MSSLIGFKENIKDNMTNTLCSLSNYLHETKYTEENLYKESDVLAKCINICGELFANKIRKGEVQEEEIDSFEALLPTEEMFALNHKDLSLASKMVKEGNDMALADRESRYDVDASKVRTR